jgi:gamma-glutamyltranspeptidase/glutathione hydrolase
MFMNDRTWWMSLGDGPNAVAPLRRANIGHAPTMLTRADNPFAALGSPGGFGIVQHVLQVIVNVVDYGLDLQRAIEAPRFRIEDLEGTVGIEQRISADTRKALATRGHRVVDYPAWTDRVGGVEGLFIDRESGNMLGGYDPRRNSCAAGLS